MQMAIWFGHTGSLPAAIKAVETVDACVGKVIHAVTNKGGALIVTADHGNCEQMIHPDTGEPHTAHTMYDVALSVVDNRYKGCRLADWRSACGYCTHRVKIAPVWINPPK